MTNAIDIRSLWYRPGGGFRLEDLSLAVPAGAVYGFLGPNGAGKTTTIKLMLGRLRAQRGAIRVLQHDVPRRGAAALARVGYVPETPHLYQSFRVREAIYYHAGFYGRWDERVAADLAARFELPPRQRLASLSKGELRKLMILLALAQRPDLLVLDEPTDGLDPVVRREILDALDDAVRSAGTTVFLSSHLVHELETVCDWIAVMDKGRLVTAMPMTQFRDEVKALSLTNAPRDVPETPFSVLRRSPPDADGRARWIVRGWRDEMGAFFDRTDATLDAVAEVSLEDGFVELLRSFRRHGGP